MSEQEDILKELKAKFDALCDEQEQLPRDGFAKVFEVLDSLEEDFTPQHPYTENEDNINKALELTGHGTDEAFCKAFKRNNQIMIEGKKMQRLGLEIALQQGKFAKPQQELPPDEWIFLTPSIFISQELTPILDEVWEKELCKADGIFSSYSDIPKENEDDDKFLMIEAYGMKCNGLQIYYRDLQSYGVISEILNKPIFKKVLLISLTNICTFIKDNTDKPNKIRNHIRGQIKWFDSIPAWGLLFQILILQGIISWFENISLEKEDKGYKDAELLFKWVMKILIEKEVSFCYFFWGDGDKKWLKPMCNYLLSTQVGQAVQERIRTRENNEKTTSEPQQEKQKPPQTLPIKLKDDEAKSLRVLLINQNQIDTGTEEETFLYWFGCGKYREEIRPITWTGTKQIARELLEGLYKSEDSSFADIEKTVPMCFIKDGKPMKLAKNKEVPSLGSDAIANFLATIKKN